jgi:hypothetical protein
MDRKASFNNDGRFDIKTEPKFLNGTMMELLSWDILSQPDMTFEVKSENKNKWGLTGNVFIEFQQLKGNEWVASGISITESDYWVIVLKDYDNEKIESIIITPTHNLKKRIKRLYRAGKISIEGKPKTKDGTATKGYIVPIQHLFLYDTEFEEDRNIRVKKALEDKKTKNK